MPPSSSLAASVWFAIPSARPHAQASACFAAWRKAGYRTAAYIDPGAKPPENVDLVIEDRYLGYASAVNWLCRCILELDSAAQWIVTGGDDIMPDTRMPPGKIAEQCRDHFAGTFGIMQPCGDGPGILGGEAGSAVSPWMGREWCRMAYRGRGPLCDDYRHYYVDTELRAVAKALGAYWERPDLVQYHDHWARTSAAPPAHLVKAESLKSEDLQRYRRRVDSHFPKSLPRSMCVARRSPAIVQLGRAGDIINILPLARALGASVVTHADYAVVGECMRDVNVVVYPGSLEDPEGAAAWAQRRFDPVYIAQQFGNHGYLGKYESFAIDAWELCGERGWMWGSVPLSLDRRNYDREQELIRRVLPKTSKPIVLLSLTGTSGPFAKADEIRAELHRQLGDDYTVVDLDSVRATRIYDLLGLYDAAAVLVTIDTATLHLAEASKIPVVYLRPRGWSSSPPRGNCVGTCRYDEVTADWIVGMVDVATSGLPVAAPAPRPDVRVLAEIATTDESPEPVILAGHRFWMFGEKLYPDYLNGGNAMQFIRHLALKHCKGTGIDIGADEWPLPGAIPIRNNPGENALDLGGIADGSLDFVFSSHCLEHLSPDAAGPAISMWAGKLKPGGTMFLYLPHPGMALWRPGSPWVGAGHRWLPTWDDVVKFMQSAGLAEIDGNHNSDAYWSWWIMGRKPESR